MSKRRNVYTLKLTVGVDHYNSIAPLQGAMKTTVKRNSQVGGAMSSTFRHLLHLEK